MTQQLPPPHADPTLPLPRHAWWQLTHTLETLLPPPLNDTPEALLARDNAAIAKISDMAPANSDEADLASTCVVVRAQAEETVRQIRRVGDSDPKETGRLNRLYLSLVRTGLSAHRQLQRTRALRQARDKDPASASADEWTRYVDAREMQQARDHRLGPAESATFAPLPLEQQTDAPGPIPAPAEAAAFASPPPVPPAAPPAAQPVATRHAAPAVPSPAAPAATPAVQPSAVRPARMPPDAGAAAQPPPRVTVRGLPDTEDPPRDLEREVLHYAALYPRRVREIRRHRGLPPDCRFGPPDDELLAALVSTRHPAVLAVAGDTRAA